MKDRIEMQEEKSESSFLFLHSKCSRRYCSVSPLTKRKRADREWLDTFAFRTYLNLTAKSKPDSAVSNRLFRASILCLVLEIVHSSRALNRFKCLIIRRKCDIVELVVLRPEFPIIRNPTFCKDGRTGSREPFFEQVIFHHEESHD